MSAVPESVEAKGPELKTLAKFERTGIEKLRRRYVPHLFPNLLDQSAQGFRTNLCSVGHAISFYRILTKVSTQLPRPYALCSEAKLIRPMLSAGSLTFTNCAPAESTL